MAENKKSFILYADLIKSVEHLTNEELGLLFRHIFDYVNDKKPILTDRLLLTAWKPIELTLKRDLLKFEEVKAKRSEAGKRSAELRALKSDGQNSTNSTSVESVQQTSTNPTDNVNVNVNDNDNVNDNVINKYTPNIPSFDEFFEYAIEKKPKVCSIDLKLKYEAWIENGWKDGNDKVINKWRSKLLQTLPYIKEKSFSLPNGPSIPMTSF